MKNQKPLRVGLLIILFIALLLPLSCRRPIRPHDRAQLHNNQGVVYLQKRQYDKAYQEFKLALEISPEFADAHHNLGVYYEQTGNLKKAEESYLRAIKSDFKFANPHNGLCSTYRRMGKEPLAIKHGKKALKKDPTLADAAYCLGSVFQDMKDYENATEYFRKATDINPNHYLGHNALGKVYLKEERYDDAVNRFKIAIEVFPTFEEARINLGYTYYRKEDLLNAQKTLEAALGNSPKNPNGHNLLGAVFLKRARVEPESALSYCTQAAHEFSWVAKQLNPQDGQAWANLGLAERCLGSENRRAGNYEKSKSLLENSERTLKKAMEIEPDFCPTYLYLGELQVDELKKEETGIATLRKGLDCNKAEGKPAPKFLYKIGMHYVQKEQWRTAKPYICEFLEATQSQTIEAELVQTAVAVAQENGGC